MSGGKGPLNAAIDDIEGAAGDGRVTVGALLDVFQNRSLGFVMVIFGLLVSIPVIGGIPGMPDIAALVILLAVIHSFVGGERRFWAPERLRRKEVEGQRVRAALARLRPLARAIDTRLSARLGPLVDSAPARHAIAAIAGFLALAMFVLSLIPFLAMPASLGILAFGLALMARDGLLALAGYVFTAASVGALAWAVGQF